VIGDQRERRYLAARAFEASRDRELGNGAKKGGGGSERETSRGKVEVIQVEVGERVAGQVKG